ncbi:MAG: DUF6134 family protein [Pseudomonadota bacterium]
MPNRRVFLTSAAAALATPAIAATTADREFRIIRDGDDIGSHRLDAATGANGFEIAITIRIAVKILGITAYRYEMDNREVWRDGRIVSVDSRVNDDGTKDRCIINARDKILSIEGSRFNGQAPSEAVTTSYYAAPFLQRRPWLSTQSGAPLDLSVKQDARAGWWSVRGELDTNLGYDDAGEWIACEFDAGGEPARYDIASGSGRIGELWASA